MMSRIIFIFSLVFLLLGMSISFAQPFKQALPGYTYHFPQDHAAHEAYKTEWWYYTGHLETPDHQTYGYELTFFRSNPALKNTPKGSKWPVRNFYLTHFALSDENQKQFRFTEKLNRARPNWAGARSDRYAIWNENWSAELKNGVHHLKAAAPEMAIDLQLASDKPPVIHGENGVSQKATCKGCASHYYSLTNLATNGTLRMGKQTYRVVGQTWMDHEFGSNQLQSEQVGWDWFALQLANGHELMLYNMRLKNGQTDPTSSGTWVDARGRGRHLKKAEYQIETLATWKSPKTGATYPAKWRITLPKEQLQVIVTPTFADQELATKQSGDTSYWEGSCRIAGTWHGKPIGGKAYVELVGYAQAFKQKI